MQAIFKQLSPRLGKAVTGNGPSVALPHARAAFARPMSTNAPARTWAWSNLSSKTRRNIVVGLSLGAVADSYVCYRQGGETVIP
ncbi:unnamed protein product [Clonostachys byssicola]|uniref:Uncharacterized protein n=1 Tax=Clonostachys byssicola TaxID=160290 RepID=A0A9N9UQB8_9HYPO|nr:unnamed protein product [Clonostachys byssicola]